MIPRRIFWLFDAALLLGSFCLAFVLTPFVRPLIAPAASTLAAIAPALSPYLEGVSGVLPPIQELAWILVVITPAVLFGLDSVGAYTGLRHLSTVRVLLAGPVAISLGLAAAALVIFALRIQNWSRLFLFVFAVVAAAGLSGIRLAVRLYHTWQARSGYYTRNLLLVAAEERVPELVRFVADLWPEREYQFIGYLAASRMRAVRLAAARHQAGAAGSRAGADQASEPLQGETGDIRPAVVVDVGGGAPIAVPKFGAAEDVAHVLVRRPVHEVVAVMPLEGGTWFAPVVAACDHAGVPLRIVPDVLLGSRPSNLRCVRETPDRRTPTILLAPRDLSADALQVKRLMDVTISTALLILLAPVFALLAILIKLTSPGAVFYRWHVVGQNGKEFAGYKFRTMVENADALKPQLMAQNEMAGAAFKMRHDPRVTPLGRWLRKYSLDELPQLWNVLKGDMSLVGPRPAFPTELQRYAFWHVRKLSIRPGITCLWQVRGRNSIAHFDDWVRMDLEYIDTWSLLGDIKILCRTVGAVLRGTGH
jgi:exopolysaccharide biosynthesis polyprenyl glycosylphosphotransferase